MGTVDRLSMLLEVVKDVAESCGMEARIVGHSGWVPATEEHAGYFDDGRLLKLVPKGNPSRLLLEVELSNGVLRLYRHRTPALTGLYRGAALSNGWVLGFIRANEALARDWSHQEVPEPQFKEQVTLGPLSNEEVSQRRQERVEVRCGCGGQNERCMRCFGSGRYVLDGFGNRVDG